MHLGPDLADNIGRIWMHNFHEFQVDESFTPQACSLNGTGKNATHTGVMIDIWMQDRTLSTASASHGPRGYW